MKASTWAERFKSGRVVPNRIIFQSRTLAPSATSLAPLTYKSVAESSLQMIAQ